MSRDDLRGMGGVRPRGTSGAIRSVCSQLALFFCCIGGNPRTRIGAGEPAVKSSGGAHPPASALVVRREEHEWRHALTGKTEPGALKSGFHEIGTRGL